MSAASGPAASPAYSQVSLYPPGSVPHFTGVEYPPVYVPSDYDAPTPLAEPTGGDFLPSAAEIVLHPSKERTTCSCLNILIKSLVL